MQGKICYGGSVFWGPVFDETFSIKWLRSTLAFISMQTIA